MRAAAMYIERPFSSVEQRNRAILGSAAVAMTYLLSFVDRSPLNSVPMVIIRGLIVLLIILGSIRLSPTLINIASGLNLLIILISTCWLIVNQMIISPNLLTVLLTASMSMIGFI